MSVCSAVGHLSGSSGTGLVGRRLGPGSPSWKPGPSADMSCSLDVGLNALKVKVQDAHLRKTSGRKYFPVKVIIAEGIFDIGWKYWELWLTRAISNSIKG